MLSVMPLFHGFGLGIGIHTALIHGGTCILVPQFSVETYARLIKKEKPNVLPVFLLFLKLFSEQTDCRALICHL